MSSERKPFLLRLDKEVLNTLQRWADDELRSLNGQIDYLLRQALKEAGRTQKDLPKKSDENSKNNKTTKRF